jgi:hypothetical protein
VKSRSVTIAVAFLSVSIALSILSVKVCAQAAHTNPSAVIIPASTLMPNYIYRTDFARTDDWSYGTMIGPGDYYQYDGASWAASGDALDGDRVWIRDSKWDSDPNAQFMMLKWQMPKPVSVVRVYPNIDNDGTNNPWDYLQWSLWGSTTGAEDKPWTLLWNPKSASGSTVDDFQVTSETFSGPMTIIIYRYGTQGGTKLYGDGFTMTFILPTFYQYFGVRASTMALEAAGNRNDPEIDAVAWWVDAARASIRVGQSVDFTSTVLGGSPPYSYQWCVDATPASGATSASWTFTPAASGIYYVYFEVTDAGNNTAQSETTRITVTALPVGGYSIQVQFPTKAEPALPYFALVTILTAIFTKLRPKTKRKRARLTTLKLVG